jgi:hypothetical protein
MVRIRPHTASRSSTNDRAHHHSIVISIFGIVILSTIGSMFATNHHSMMGANDDPADGKAVATAVFGAVAVYAVRIHIIKTGKQRQRDKYGYEDEDGNTRLALRPEKN